jgi:hypothetical protein
MGSLNTVKNGKGSKPRPFTDIKKFADNWDAIFSKKYLAKQNKTCDTPKHEEANSTSVTENRLES